MKIHIALSSTPQLRPKTAVQPAAGFLRHALAGLASLVFFACSDVRLNQKPPGSVIVESKGEFCLQSPDTNSRITKFMFVIDKSGSNDSTDPNNHNRADAIETFFNAPGTDGIPRRDNPNVKWGYITFQSDTAAAYINDGKSDVSPIYVGVNDTPNSTVAMGNALKRQRSDSDGGSTPYHEALGLVQKAIQNDLKAHPDEDSEYLVFFMSDGMPTDYNGLGNEEPAGPAAFADVDNLVKIVPGHVHFSTAYYGPRNQAAADGLSKMALEHGFGKFVDLNDTTDFKIDDLLIAGNTLEPYNIKQFMVYNVNSALGLDSNEMCVDSDGDGLCDDDELKLNSDPKIKAALQKKYPGQKIQFDPQNRFSFNDGYGDYFHYRELLGLETLKPCADRSDEDHDLLTACEEAFMQNDSPILPPYYSGKNSNPKDPDTDGDGFIDGIEYFMMHSKAAPMDRTDVTKHPTVAMYDTADLMIQHRNPMKWNPNLPPEEIYDPHLEFQHFNSDGQRCYSYTQNHMRAYHTLTVGADKTLAPEYAHGEWDNVVLIYYLQTLEKDPNSAGIYNYSLQRVSGRVPFGTDNAKIIVDTKLFKSYVPATPTSK